MRNKIQEKKKVSKKKKCQEVKEKVSKEVKIVLMDLEKRTVNE